MATLTIDSAYAIEGDLLTFTIRLSEPTDDAVTVSYRAISGIALYETDFDDSSATEDLEGTITFDFATSETTRTISFFAREDALLERDEAFSFELFNPIGADLGGDNRSLRATGWILDDDRPGNNRSISVSGPIVAERIGSEAEFTITLSRAFDVETTLTYETFDLSARAGRDYIAGAGEITFGADQTEATVVVDLVNNAVVETAEAFGLRVSGIGSTPGATGTATVLDPDGDPPILSIEGTRALEGAPIVFTVRLSEPADDAVRVGYRTVSGSGLVETDVFDTSATDDLQGEVVFAAGETAQTITLEVASDSIDELDENFAIELFNPVGGEFGGANHSLRADGWILDDPVDGPGNNRAIAISGPMVIEGRSGLAEFTVSLSNAFTTETTLTYATFNGSARAGVDYAAKAGGITFAAGQTEAKVLVSLINDTAPEAAESFGLRVSGSGATIGATGAATVLDPDADLPTLTIEGDRALENNLISFVVRLSKPADDAVSVSYRTLAGLSLLDTDVFDTSATDDLEGEIVFDPGQTTRTITLQLGSDSLDELDENFVIQLFNPVGIDLGGANQSLRAAGWILDDDGPGVNRVVAVSNPTIIETPSAATSVAVFDVELSRAHSQRLEFDYTTVNGTARAGSDYDRKAGTVVFEAGQTKAQVVVNVDYDASREGNETFALRLDTPFPSAISGSLAAASGTATIVDGSILGTPQNDRLRGTPLGDAIAGRSGADQIFGLGGADALSGDGGADRLFGGGGRDRLFGGEGDDLLNGGSDADRMAGGRGDDTYVLETARDRAIERADEGRDLVEAALNFTLDDQLENLTLTGGRDLDGLGNALDNAIRGNAGRNDLGGARGDDRLSGGAGADQLTGGLGADVMSGGTGVDRFVFRSETEAGRGRGRDVITDFERGRDEIDLRGIDANEDRPRDQRFDFVASARFSDTSGELRFAGGVLQGDLDGDGRADFEIELAGLARLSAGDILL